MNSPELYNLAPLVRMALLGMVLALGPLAWVWMRHAGAPAERRLRALIWLTVFLCFDLIVFGAFTRLTDSGLGCPDWPGCYGNASPVGASHHIAAAQSAMPTGPVTFSKAWIEMIHRYLATAVGVLITVIAIASWVLHRQRTVKVSPWWATAALIAVCLQGAFGALTVTMKLYPAIVTGHLLGGLSLLALLAVLGEMHQAEGRAALAHRLPPAWRMRLAVLAALVFLQVALGGWVSTNYAVLACSDFPTCQGQWWPPVDFDHGFTVLRELGTTRDGDYLSFAALTAIHLAHRLGALVVLPALVFASIGLRRHGGAPWRGAANALAALAAWQLISGLSNVVLGWPLVAALAHTGGAAATIALVVVLVVRACLAVRPVGEGVTQRRPAVATS
jgi:heme a synthase